MSCRILSQYAPGPKTDHSKVLLIALHSSRFPIIGESLGVCAISGYLQETSPEICVRSMDMQLDDVGTVLRFVRSARPAIVGISAKLQTLNEAVRMRNAISDALPSQSRPLIVVGNALANVAGKEIIEKHMPGTIAATGDGELALQDLLEYVQGLRPIHAVRNVLYVDEQGFRFGQQDCLEGKDIPSPERLRSRYFFELGAEIYVEASRGCPYGRCSFCGSRGSSVLSDRQTWRRRPFERVVEDLLSLQRRGISKANFADEEFFGSDHKGMLRLKRLALQLVKERVKVQFRVNARVDSIADPHDSDEQRRERRATLLLLKKAGLSKVFLGIEAGAPSQLKRYSKGFSLSDARAAVHTLRQLGVPFEAGFILADPLVSIPELQESLRFLEVEDLIQNVSSVFKELRLLTSTPYIQQVRNAEGRLQMKLLGTLDASSQEYSVARYADPQVDLVVRFMRQWMTAFYKPFYLLRVLTQHIETNIDALSSGRAPGHFFACLLAQERQREYDLLSRLVSLPLNQQSGRDRAAQLLETYERARIEAAEGAIHVLRERGTSPSEQRLCEELGNYAGRRPTTNWSRIAQDGPSDRPAVAR